MGFLTYGHRFSQLRSLIGFRAAIAFSLTHLWNKLLPPRGGALACVKVGPYTFYFPSIEYFVGLFTEIFFEDTYLIAPTNTPIRVIDCGANIGVSLLYIKIQAPHAQVLCFEPNPAARNVLEKNIAANKWEKDVRVLPYALGKAKGSVDFYVDTAVPTSSGGGVAKYTAKNRPLSSYPVEVAILSPYITSAVDILKMDIEGGEFDVIEELVATETLRSIASIQLEYHYIPRFFTRPLSDMLTLLEQGGFQTFTKPTGLSRDIVGSNRQHAYMIFAWRPK